VQRHRLRLRSSLCLRQFRLHTQGSYQPAQHGFRIVEEAARKFQAIRQLRNALRRISWRRGETRLLWRRWRRRCASLCLHRCLHARRIGDD